MTEVIVFLFGGLIAGALIEALHETHQVQGTLSRLHLHVQRHGKHFPKALGMLILVAHASEVGRVVSHTTPVHLIAAILLFVLWVATEQREKAEEVA